MYILLWATLLLFSGCDGNNSKYTSSQQGIPAERLHIEEIRKGMTKTAVRNILGEASHIHPFYPNRWIYSYLQHGLQKNSRVVIVFTNNQVSEVIHN